MARNTKTTMCRDGYRRSPRLCAFQDSWKDPKSTRLTRQTFRRSRRSRRRNTRQLSPIGELDEESPDNEDHHLTNIHQPLVMQAKDKSKNGDEDIPIREKRVLELIIDILQRRDTHEIFAEPVDPSEVEDYYSIIKEPMDFGTMRAKLHEGMYKNLDQFKHDVFLISNNAMHFNPSDTMYFRQARAMHELSQKVFHVLKTEPEKLESEFTSTRRRSGRKPREEVTTNLCAKKGLNPKCRNYGSDPSFRSLPSSSNNPSKPKRNLGVTQGCFSNFTATNNTAQEFFSGSNSVEEDRRGTYRPLMRFNTENNPKPLIRVNQQNFGYKESLLLFSKDLGPVAQMVAKQKLQAYLNDPPLSRTPNTENPAESSSPHWRSCASKNIIESSSTENVCTQIQSYTQAPIDMAKKNRGTEIHDRNRMKFVSIFTGNEIYPNNFVQNKLASEYYGTANIGKNQPSKTGSDYFQRNISNFTAGNMNSSEVASSSWASFDSPTWASNGNRRSAQTGQCIELNQPMPSSVSRYAFNLPYLKSRLSQMNSIGDTTTKHINLNL